LYNVYFVKYYMYVNNLIEYMPIVLMYKYYKRNLIIRKFFCFNKVTNHSLQSWVTFEPYGKISSFNVHEQCLGYTHRFVYNEKKPIYIYIILINRCTFSSRIISVGQSQPDRYLWQFFHVKWFEHVFGHDAKLVSVNIKLLGQIIFDVLHLLLLHSNWPRRQILKTKQTRRIDK